MSPSSLRDAPPEIRHNVQRDFAYYVIGTKPGFGKSVGDRMEVKELAYCLKTSRAMGSCELTVAKDMLGGSGDTMHDGCTAYLIDMGTALPFVLLGQAEKVERLHKPKFTMAPYAPSQKLEITFINPAPLDTHLKLVAKTISHASSALLVSGELWDMDRNQMIAHATHYKVMPKRPPKAALELKL